jgi:hypothetical protein
VKLVYKTKILLVEKLSISILYPSFSPHNIPEKHFSLIVENSSKVQTKIEYKD